METEAAEKSEKRSCRAYLLAALWYRQSMSVKELVAERVFSRPTILKYLGKLELEYKIWYSSKTNLYNWGPHPGP